MSKVFMISSNTASDPYPVYPIGMAIVSAALIAGGHEVCQYDVLVHGRSEERLREAILRFDPNYVGISLRNIDNVDSLDPTRAWYLATDRDLVRVIRTVTSAPVMVGGAGFSIMPAALLDYLGADYGVVGEGEYTICGLIDGLDSGRPVPRITGHGSRNGRTPASPHKPWWDRDLVDFYKQESGMMNILTKRGCPYHCSYCTYPAIEGPGIRHREPDNVVDEIEQLMTDHGVDTFYFTDSVFNDEEGGCLRLAETIVRRGLLIKWTAFFRPARIGAEDWALFKRSGLYAIEAGSDASNDAALAGLNKSFTFDDIYEFNEETVREQIPCAHYVMFGGPGETEASLKEGLRNLERLRNCMVMAFSGIRILPSTTLRQRAIDDGIIDETTDLLEPAYYMSPAVDADRLYDEIAKSFGRRMDRIFPPYEGLSMMKKLNGLGYRGLLWDRLVRFP